MIFNSSKAAMSNLSRAFCAVIALLTLAACSSKPKAKPENFRPIEKPVAAALMSKEDLALIEESVNPVYRIGNGDAVRIDVFGRPEVSGRHVVGPDGKISLPLAGDIVLNDLTRDEGRNVVSQRLNTFFLQP